MKLSNQNLFRRVSAVAVAALGLVAVAFFATADQMMPFKVRGLGQIIGGTDIPPSPEYPFGATALVGVDGAIGTHLGKFSKQKDPGFGRRQAAGAAGQLS